ncbi:SAP30-binding protein-like [Panonychus citri]|uniref:SAP30-binding protein-like n=1 Tax=Panonychus citri TaxID=50023 RepID=UPI002307E843|nr:SAP30-binding protein-like [Panonychus citri]
MENSKSNALASLTNTYHDSDIEESPNISQPKECISPEEISTLEPIEPLEQLEQPPQSSESPKPPEEPQQIIDTINSPPLRLPPPPPGQPPVELVQKINHLHAKMKQGIDMKASIEKLKNFRNPSIYEKLITFCEIDELGTNFPKDVYDPHQWGADDFYDNLTNAQKLEMEKKEMEKKEKKRKEKVTIEFVSGTIKKNRPNA